MKTSSKERSFIDTYSEKLDRSLQTNIAKLTGGLSPASVMLAYYDWLIHLTIQPSKQLQLIKRWEEGIWELMRLNICASTGKKDCSIESQLTDKRFADPAWQQYPYQVIAQSFLLMEDWWKEATTKVRGVNQHHLDVLNFMLRQYMDMISPANSPLTNPEVQSVTAKQYGMNFVKGYENFLDDVNRFQMDEPPHGAENFVIGKNIAVTKGKVIYRNHLIELIQYSPMTEEVYAEPVLITPAWIMKYYILDLTPQHSLVKYLVEKGHTVFMISWRNPETEDANLGMEDYLDMGILSALTAINHIVPKEKVHLVGYCLGGTLTAIATSLLAREHDNRLASMTMLAAQVDFTEPGELGLFIDESQISYLENLMREDGYLDTHQMAGAFQLLRSNDLIWSRIIREYLIGERKPLTDLMAWNADGTRLPYRMHSEYLRKLFLHNELAEGKYIVKGKPIALPDIRIPIFVVATEKDHVSPWHSVFQINLLTTGDVTFTLTSGGHNVGIVSLPSKTTHRRYRISHLKKSEKYIDAETWYQRTEPTLGSWWPAWEQWLVEQSSKKAQPPQMGNSKVGYTPLEDAPGTYVLQK